MFDVKDATYVLYPQYCILFVYIFGTYANSFFVFFYNKNGPKTLSPRPPPSPPPPNLRSPSFLSRGQVISNFMLGLSVSYGYVMIH